MAIIVAMGPVAFFVLFHNQRAEAFDVPPATMGDFTRLPSHEVHGANRRCCGYVGRYFYNPHREAGDKFGFAIIGNSDDVGYPEI